MARAFAGAVILRRRLSETTPHLAADRMAF
jgi:hypothetical protein